LSQVIEDIFSSQVASEHNYFWLTSLHGICEAEACVDKSETNMKTLMSQVAEMLVLYQKALVSLKVCVFRVERERERERLL
jgi:hypothetical protein